MNGFLNLRIVTLFLCAFFFCAPFARAQDEQCKDSRGDNVLLWASDATSNVPFVFYNPAHGGKIGGFEFDLMQALAQKMGLHACFIQNGWDGLIPGLSRGAYQAVIDGIEITPDRREKILFSNPYLKTENVLVMPKSGADYRNLDDLKNATVGAIKSSAAERILAQNHISARTYDEESALFSDLHSHRLDAALVDRPIGQYYGGDDLKIADKPVGEISYGIVLAPFSEPLRVKFNHALDDIKADGTLDKILASWNLAPQGVNVPVADRLEWNAYKAAMDRAKAHGFKALLKRYASFAPALLHGAEITILVSVVSMLIAIIVGAIVALGRIYGPKWIRVLSLSFVEVWRGTPLLIQLLFIFYGLPEIGIAMPPFVAGIIALGMNYSAYEAENYRTALGSIPVEQKEAGQALNFTSWQILRRILIPQAIPRVIPIMTNDFIALLKDSSLVSIITLTDLTQVYVRISSTYYDYLGAGLLIGAIYLLLGMPFVRLAHKLEEKTQSVLNTNRH